MSNVDPGAQDAAGVTSLHRITPADLEYARQLGELVAPNLHGGPLRVAPSQPEFHELSTNDETLERVKGMQFEYWNDFFRGPPGQDPHFNMIACHRTCQEPSLNALSSEGELPRRPSQSGNWFVCRGLAPAWRYS